MKIQHNNFVGENSICGVITAGIVNDAKHSMVVNWLQETKNVMYRDNAVQYRVL